MLESMYDLHSAALSVALSFVALFYFVGLAIYRLYFSPIAKFPGPKLAAATYLYEIYYDVVMRGKYTWKIRDLHAKYGHSLTILPSEYELIRLQDQLSVSTLPSCISTIQTTMTASTTEKASGRRIHTT